MPHTRCCIINCKSVWDKDLRIQFHRFPCQNKAIIKYWIAATGRKNWSSYTSARICSLHFRETDYYTTEHSDRKLLKPNVYPTQNVHQNILQTIQQNTSMFQQLLQVIPHTVKKYEPKNTIILDEDDITNKENKKLNNNKAIILNEDTQMDKETEIYDHNENSNRNIEEMLVENNNNKTTIVNVKCSKCVNYEQLIRDKEQLIKKTEELQQSYEKRLNEQAKMFNDLIKRKETEAKGMLKIVKEKNKTLNRNIQRKIKRITNLKTIFKYLKSKNMLENDAAFRLTNEFGNLLAPLLQNEKKNIKTKSAHGHRYSEEVKRFASTMHYYSPKAYSYCRTIFKLPHPSAIRNWTSTVNAQPGFQSEVLTALTALKDEDKDCCLIFDSMAIRQQILWDTQQHKYIGFCDYGNNVNVEQKDIECTEALVFMLVSLRGVWKWPIAYFLKHSITAITLAELIKTALTLTAESGLRIRAITCDGDSVNCNALQLLGANIFVDDYRNIKNFVQHVTMQYKVRVLLDPCHMIKLARNTLADYELLKSDEHDIKWAHIIQLHALQTQLTFKLKNRLSSQCIYWKQNKMKVKYAAHALSASVANAIEFLQQEGLEQFQNSNGTIQFIRIIDRLFDLLNSRSPFGKGFKQPITQTCIPQLKTMVEKYVHYLFSLRNAEGKLLRNTSRKTFIYGLVIAAQSVLDVAEDIFVENTFYKYILTYKFSQDHVELLFSKIRSRHGYNNNPNARQFQIAMRQILLRNDIKHSTQANCIALDTDLSGSIFKFTWKKQKQFLFTDITDDHDSDDECTNRGSKSVSPSMTKLTEYIMYYLCGYIVKTIKINCYSCAISLRKSQHEHNYAHTATFAKFLDFCNNGGLLSPSLCVFKICMETEKRLDIATDGYTELSVRQLDLKVITEVKNKFALDPSIFPNLQCDNMSISDIPHKIRLLTLICSRYIKVRLHSYAKFYLQEIVNPIRKRHRLTKQILFYRE